LVLVATEFNLTIYYPLPLIGADTPHVECLSSYMGRLAFAHSVTMGDLLTDIVTRSGELKFWRSTRSAAIASECGAVDGLSNAASAVLRCLIKWTGQQTLRQANLIFLWEQIAHVAPGTMKQNRCWCVECYRRMEPDARHEPLIWRIASVKNCPIHRCLLEEHCPRCGSTQPIVGWPTGRLQCCTCRGSLLAATKKRISHDESGSNLEEDAWQEWLCSQLAELFSVNARDNRLANMAPGQFSEFLRETRKRFDLTWNDMREQFQFPGTIDNWHHRGSRPSLPNLFLVCACAKVDVVGVLLYPREAAASVIPSNLSSVRRLSKGLTHRMRIENNRASLAKCRDIVNNWPRSQEPRLEDICNQAGFAGQAHLYLHAPELISQIKAMRASFLEDKRAKLYARSEDFCERLRAENPFLGRWALARKVARESGCTYKIARQIVASMS
jgi:hypothetical protein